MCVGTNDDIARVYDRRMLSLTHVRKLLPGCPHLFFHGLSLEAKPVFLEAADLEFVFNSRAPPLHLTFVQQAAPPAGREL